jgi:hypothetical protein
MKDLQVKASYLVQSICLVGSSDEDHDLPSVHDGSNPDGQGLLGNLRQVSIKEPGIGLDRVLVK